MKEFIINVEPLETRIAFIEEKRLTELLIDRHESRSVVGNVYKGRVDSIVPGIQAAFVDIGFEKNGFLYVSDIAGAEGTGDFVFEEGTAKPKERSRRGKPPAIESLLKKNQHIMVQVSKDTLGTKGVRLTNYVTLPGRYIVLMPTVKHLGISRKIGSERERERLRKTLQSIRPAGVGMILRTAGEDKKKVDFQDDIKYLSKVWSDVKDKMESMKGPSLLHQDLSSILRIVRDMFTKDVEKLTIDNEHEHKNIMEFLDTFAPNLKKRVKLYTGKRPIFDKFNIEKERGTYLYRPDRSPGRDRRQHGTIHRQQTSRRDGAKNQSRRCGGNRATGPVTRLGRHHRHRFHRHAVREEPQGTNPKAARMPQRGPGQDDDFRGQRTWDDRDDP
jgi:ribonuclease G